MTAALLALAFVSPPPPENVFRAEPFRYGRWHQTAIGGGGFVQDVFLTRNPKVRYVSTDVGGCYRTDDGGKTYRLLLGHMPIVPGTLGIRGMDADPRDENVVLAATGSHWENEPSGLMRSTDGGKTWAVVAKAKFGGNGDERWTGRVLARSPKNPDLLLAGTMGDGLIRSTDGGKTWTSVGEGNRFIRDVKWADDGKTAWASAATYTGYLFGAGTSDLQAAFFRSDDAGATWTKLADGSPTEVLPLKGELLGIFGSRRVRSSKDGGRTWTDADDGLRLGNGQGPSSEEYNALAKGPGFVLTASTEGEFYRRADGATKWERLPDPKLEETYRGEPWHNSFDGKNYRRFGKALSSIIVFPDDPKNHWAFTDWFSIRETTDAGKTWRMRMDGVELTVIHNLLQDAADPGRVHIGMADNGYLLSLEGGARFGDDGPEVTSTMRTLQAHPTDPKMIVGAGNQGNGQWVSDRVWRSDDGGESWRRSGQIAPGVTINSACFDPGDSKTLYATASGDVGPGKGGVYVSKDDGSTWNWMGAGLPADRAIFHRELWQIGREIACPLPGRPVALGIDAGEVWGWDGTAWVSRTKADGGNDLFADPWGRLLLADGSGLRRSTDGGLTWALLLTGKGAGRNVAPDLAKKGRIALATRSNLYLSTDDGKTWADLSNDLPNRFGARPAFAGERLIVGTDGVGLFWTALSPEGEKPVRAKPVPPAPSVVKASDFRIVWTGAGSLTLRTDPDLVLASASGTSQGSAGVELPPGSYRIQASLSHDRAEEALFAIQSFDAAGKQVDWQTLADVTKTGTLDARITTPAGAARSMLTVITKGPGSVMIRNLRVTR